MADTNKMTMNKNVDTNNAANGSDNGRCPELNLGMLSLLCAPIKVKAHETFSITLACHTDPVEDDKFRVYRKTKYMDRDGKEHMMPIAGMVHARQDSHQFSFDQLMFYNPSFEVKVQGQWFLEFVLESDTYFGELSKLIVPIVVE